jgi:spore germination cell wall hydrolase CwlJ-like protein
METLNMNAVDILRNVENYFDRNHNFFCLWGGLFAVVFFGIFIPFRMLALQGANLNAQLSAYQTQNSYLASQVDDMSREMTFLQLSYDEKQKVMREVECLARNIYFEASGEPRTGKIAVAEVTMNRVKDKQYPRTVCAVVHQKAKGTCQFSWVCQGKTKVHKRSRAWEESIDIAENILISKREYGIIGDAMYFHATYVEPSWAEQKKLIRKIGNHIFYH